MHYFKKKNIYTKVSISNPAKYKQNLPACITQKQQAFYELVMYGYYNIIHIIETTWFLPTLLYKSCVSLYMLISFNQGT